MPIILHICPTCNGGVKQTRGWQWIDPRPWIGNKRCTDSGIGRWEACPLARPQVLGERVGLIWIGEMFYATPAHFTMEAAKLGISRRIQAVPRGFKVGETWVFLAHPKVTQITHDDGTTEWVGGVFQIMRPTRVEKIVTDEQARDPQEMQKLLDAGITPVVVPADDKDHRGSPFDKDDEATLL